MFLPLNSSTIRFTRWVDQRRRYTCTCIFQINAVNQAFQCARKKPLIDWLIRNQWWLRQQANSSLYSMNSNHGLSISHRNNQINDRVGEWTNEGGAKIEWSIYWQQTILCEPALVCGALLIDVKQAILPKQCPVVDYPEKPKIRVYSICRSMETITKTTKQSTRVNEIWQNRKFNAFSWVHKQVLTCTCILGYRLLSCSTL